MPVVSCPHCQSPVKILAEDFGYRVQCPGCQRAFQAGDQERAAPESAEEKPTSPPSSETPPESEFVAVTCTGCQKQIEISRDDLGHRVACPLCEKQFLAQTEAQRAKAAVRKQRSRYDPANDDDYDNDTDYGYRSRRGNYRPEEREYILRAARAAIAWPANGLMWTGIVFLILYWALTIGLIAKGIIDLDSRSNYERDEAPLFFFFAAGAFVFGTLHGSVLAIGGYRAKQLRSTGWAYTGAALGIATIALSHPCLPTTWAAVTFGIWMLVALGRREVKDAIAINTGKGV